MKDAPCLMLSGHFEGNPNDLTTNDGVRCLDDLSEHGVVLRLQKHSNDDAAQRRHHAAVKMLTIIQERLAPVRSRAKTTKRDAAPTAPEKPEGIAGTVLSSD
jgi:hypothetical protein